MNNLRRGMNMLLKITSKGSAVTKLQEDLKTLGYFNVTPSGYFGQTTRIAVTSFQSDYNLHVDGIVGPKTIRQIADIIKSVNSNYILEILRDSEIEDATLSKLTLYNNVTGKILYTCEVLEREGPSTLASGQRKRVVEGSYKMKWQTRTGLDGIRNHLPVPWLYNDDVPDTRYIYIHNGNYAKNTDGCLLTGKGRFGAMVTSSVNALIELKQHLSSIGIENVKVEIINAIKS